MFDFLLIIEPMIMVYKAFVSFVGSSDLLTAAFAFLFISWLFVLKIVIQYQIDPQIGYWSGLRLGLSHIKSYVASIFGN